MLFFYKKARTRQYTAETIIDANYTDDLLLLVNTPGQAESAWSRQQAVSMWTQIKPKFTYFNQDGTISS